MTAITTGTGLGQFATSLDTLGDAYTGGNALLGRSGQSDAVTVNTVTGNLIVQRQDEYLPAHGLDLGLLRTYNSQGQFDGDNNDQWQLSVYRRLLGETGTRNTVGATITRVGQDGASTVFTYHGALGVYRSTDGAGAHDTLAYNPTALTWTYTDGSTRTTETYNIAGQLVREADLDGNTTTYTYTGSLVTQLRQTAQGVTQTLDLDYNASNQVTQVRLGRINGTTESTLQTRVRYVYDSANRLSQVIIDLSPADSLVTDGRTYATTYTYDGTSKRLASITQGDGTRLGITYIVVAGLYKVDTLTDGIGRVTRYTYISPTQTDVTDPLGYVTTYRTDASQRLAEVLSPAVNGSRLSTQYRYDADGNLTQVITPNGNAVVYQYDAYGNAILTRDALGNTQSRTYSATQQRLTESLYLTPDPDGAGPLLPSNPQTTRYAYDSENHLRFVISATGRVTEYRYNALGAREAIIQYQAGVYPVGGLGYQAALTEAQLTTWVATQDKTQTLRTDYTYDFHGLVQNQITYAKVDATGAGIVNTSATVTTTYQANGDRFVVLNANGGYTIENVDGLGRRTSLTTSLGQTTLRTYDDANNTVRTTLADGLTQTAVYNRAGELVSTFDSPPALLQQDFQTNSDGLAALPAGYFTRVNGRLVVTPQALAAGAPVEVPAVVGTSNLNFNDNVIFRAEVNTGPASAGRYFLIGAENTGTVAAKTYRRYAAHFSGNQLLVSYFDPTSAALWQSPVLTTPSNLVKDNTTYVVEVLTQSSGTTLYVYEQGKDRASGWTHTLAGASWHTDWGVARVLMQTRGAPAQLPSTVYVDNLSLSKPPLSQIRYTYDANGRLRHTTDALGLRTYTLYDDAGRPTATIDATGALTETVYNSNGLVAKTLRYAVRLNAAQLAGLTNADGTPTAISLAGLTASLASADNRIQYKVYDSANHLVYEIDADRYVTTTVYDGAGRVTEVIRHHLALASVPVGNLTPASIIVTADISQDRRTRYFYDADGNRIGVLDAEGYLSETRYNAAGLVTTQVRYATATTASLRATGTFTALQQALTAQGPNAADQIDRTFYNAKNQLIATLNAEGYLTEYAYDINGNRTQVTRWAKPANADSATATPDTLRPSASLASDPIQDQVSRATYDALNRLESETNAEGTVSVYRYDIQDRLIAVTRGLETITDPANITQTYLDGTQRVGVIASGKLIGYERDNNGKIVRERHYANPPQPALWTQDFSNNNATGLSGLSPPYLQVAGNRLVVTTQNTATATTVTTTGTRSYAITENVIYRADVSTSGPNTGRYLLIGAQSANTANRTLAAVFDGDNLYAAYHDTSGVYRTTLLSSPAKPLKNFTAYVVEVRTTATGISLYVYERGKDAQTGVSYNLTQSDWINTRLVLQTQGTPGRIAGTLYVDNVSEKRPFIGAQAQYADVTGDGKADLLYQSTDNRFWVAPALGTATGTGFASLTPWVQHGGTYTDGQAHYADVNGDRKADLIYQGLDNRFWVSLSTGNTFTAPVEWVRHGDGYTIGQAQYADVNADGKADLIFQGPDNRFWVSLSTGTGFTAPVEWVRHGGTYVAGQARYADLNADGKADLIFQGPDNRFWVSLSTGNTFTAPVEWVRHGGTYAAGQAQYADVNADRKADLIFQGPDNRFWVSLSNGTGFTAPVEWVRHGGTYVAGQARYADLKADGKADLIFQGPDNRFWVSLSTGTGFTAPVEWVRHGGTYVAGQAQFADVNGDSQVDLVFQGNDNGFWLSTSTGTGFTPPRVQYGQSFDQLALESNTDTIKTYIYSTADIPLGRTLPDSRTTTYRYDLQGRRIGELSGIGTGYLEAYTANIANPAPFLIDLYWDSYGVKHAYDANGRRISTTDQNGDTTYFYYDAQDRLRYTLSPADDGATLINQGEVSEYLYNAFGQVTDTRRYATRISTLGLSGGVITQTLTDRITAIANASKDARTQTTYTLRGAIQRTLDPENAATSYSYNAFGERNSVLQSISATTSLTTNTAYDRRGLALSETQSGDVFRLGFVNTYDAFGRLTAQLNSNGHTTTYTYDRLGRTVVVTDPLAATRRTTYDAFDRVYTHTDALNQTTTYTYSETDRSITITTPEGIRTTTQRDRFGERVSVGDGRGNTSTFSYDKNGNLIGATDAAGNTTLNIYDSADRRIYVLDASFHRIEYTYDAANRVLTRTQDSGGLQLKTTYTYDALGRTATVIDPRGITTRTEYDRKGQVKRVIVDPSDAAKGYTGLNLITDYTYDSVGHTLSVIVGAGTAQARATHYVYNAFGQRIQDIVDPNGLKLSTRYAYDNNNNLVAKTEGDGTPAARLTRFVYDANDRRIYQVDASGGVIKTEYDSAGRVSATYAYAYAIALAGLTTQIIESDLNLRLRPNTATDRITRYAYDKDGRLVFTTDATRAVVENVYDKNGEIVKRIAYAATLPVTNGTTLEAIRAFYANPARSTTQDQITRSAYDGLNRPVYHIDALGNVTQTVYDKSGNIIRTVAYGNALTAANLAALDSAPDRTTFIASVLTPNATRDRTTRTVYDNANRAVYTIDALGYVTETQYDDGGNILGTIAYYNAITLTGLPTVPTTANIATALAARTGTQPIKDQRSYYGYDGAGRLTTTLRALGTAELTTDTTTYDATGLVIRRTKGNALATTYYAYDAAGRQRRTIDALGYVVDTTYDALGNTQTNTLYTNKVALPTTPDPRWAYNAQNPSPNTNPLSGDRTTIYTYDPTGRLQTKTAPSLNGQPGIVTRNTYDAFGNATDIVEAAGLPEQRTTRNLYDLAGRLTQQTSAYGTPEATTVRFTFDTFGNQKTYLDPRGIELAEQDTDWAKAERLRLDYTTGTGATLRAKLTSELTPIEKTVLRALYTTTQYFDLNNRKTSVIDALGNITRTDYDAFGNIVKATDPNNNPGYFYYDARNRLSLQIDPEGYATQTLFDAQGNTTETIKYANKVQGTYTQTTPIQIRTTAPASGPYLIIDTLKDQRTLADYDALNRTSKITDAEGHAETFQYDALGNVKAHTDKNGNTFSYDYDANNNKITEYLSITSANASNQQVQVVNRFEYDAVGNKIKTTEAQGLPEQRVTQYIYDKTNRLVETVEPQVLVNSQVSGTGGGFVLSPSGGSYSTVSQNIYTDSINISSVSSLAVSWSPIVGYGNGNIRVVWSTGTTSLGNVSTVVGAQFTSATLQGATGQIDYTYDGRFLLPSGGAYTVSIYKITSRGDVLITRTYGNYPTYNVQYSSNDAWTASAASQIVPAVTFTGQPTTGKTLRLSFWPASDPSQVTEVDLLDYAPGVFTSSVSDESLFSQSGYFGYVARVFTPQGEVVNSFAGTYSNINGVTSTTVQPLPITIGVLQTPHTFNAYDARSNLVRETDAKGYITYHYYDANNRRTGTIDAEGFLHRYYYNAAGNKIAERIYADRLPGSVNLATLPDPTVIPGVDATRYRETTYRYNANNLLIESATRPVLTYSLAAGLRTQPLVTRTLYDATGNTIAITDPNGNVQRFYYNKAGHRIAQVDPKGYVTAWIIDAQGNILRETRYASALSTATLAGLTPTSNPALFTAEAGAGTQKTNDRVTTYTYDKVNRRTQETLLDAGYATFNNAINGALTLQTGAAISTRYDYDNLVNIIAKTSNGVRTDYAYDALGRKTKEQGPSVTDFEGVTVRSTTTTRYDGIGNIKTVTRLGKTTADDQVTRYDYDAHGNLIKETDPLGGPTTYYYDLNGNITVKHSRRTNPDGTAPAIDTLYTYDKRNQQTSTTDANNFTYRATYNAYGDIIYKGLNTLTQQEYYDYDDAGRLIKTNKDDGVNRAYLYDANGNETAKIQSANTDTDIKPLTINQIATLAPTLVQVSQSIYDTRNQLVETRLAPITFTSESVAIQHVWVDAMPGGVNDPFSGGDIRASGGQVAVDPFFIGLPTSLSLQVSLPPDVSIGDGNIKVVFTADGPNWVIYAWLGPINSTVTSVVPSGTQTVVLPPLYGYPAYGTTTWGTISVYKETTQGEVLIVSNRWNYNNNRQLYQAPSLLNFTGQRTEAQSLNLYLWPVGGSKPATPVAVPKTVTTSGTPIAGWFAFDWTAYAAGNYEYEFETLDSAGKSLDHVKGTLTLGANPTVNSKFIDKIVPVGTPNPTATTNLITRTQTYNAFGDVIQETDGRGFATDLVYDKRGQLVQKRDPQTNVTLENGLVTRQRPATQYFYDYFGRAVGLQDANNNLTAQRYDAAGQLVAEHNGVISAAAYVETSSKLYAFDIFGNRRYVDNELRERTRYTYDRKNRIQRIDRPTDASFVSGNGAGYAARYELYEYDEANRRIKHTNALGATERTYYDDIGRVKQTTSYEGVVTRYRYIYDDATGGTKTITLQNDGKTLEDTKNYFGKLLQHKDLGGRTFNYTYNLAGWLTQQTGDTDLTKAGLEQNIAFRYYHNGYLSDIIDAGVNSRTRYEYDKNGNRTFEGYYQAAGAPTYYQWTRATYDELNRVTNLDDPKYNLTYEYDAAGNRRRAYAYYHDGLGGDVRTQDYWYKYDDMNRFTVTKGTLQGVRGSGTIIAGAEGYAIAYNAAGERTAANNESYTYTVDGLLKEAKIAGVVRARRLYDATGNTKEYTEYGTDGSTVTRRVAYTYTPDGRTKTETDGSSASTYFYDTTGTLQRIIATQPGGTTLTTTYAYEYWDSAKQKEIQLQASNAQAPGWAPGFSRFTYDVNGHLRQVSDVVADRHLRYQLDASGLILQRNELRGTQSSRTQNYYYLNGIGIGDAGGFGTSGNDYVSLLAARGTPPAPQGGPVSSVDFDYNYQPINDRYPATTPGTYSVRANDTLASIALAVWGDSSLWYLISDANGIDANTPLIPNQSLVIPNVVANVHNNAATFRVYDAGQRIGDTSPTLPDAPPPPIVGKDEGCGAIGQILVIVVTIVVAIFAPEALGVSEGFAAAAGNVAGQVVANIVGLQDGFSWSSLASSVLSAGILSKLGLNGNIQSAKISTTIVNAIERNLVTQGVNLLTGQQEKFNWSSLAIAGITAPINSAIDNNIAGISNASSTIGATAKGFFADFGASLAKNVINESASLLVNKGGTIQWTNIAGNVLGTALGNALAADAFQDSRIAQRDTQIANFQDNGYGYNINPNGSVTRNGNDYTPTAYVNTGNNGSGGADAGRGGPSPFGNSLQNDIVRIGQGRRSEGNGLAIPGANMVAANGALEESDFYNSLGVDIPLSVAAALGQAPVGFDITSPSPARAGAGILLGRDGQKINVDSPPPQGLADDEYIPAGTTPLSDFMSTPSSGMLLGAGLTALFGGPVLGAASEWFASTRVGQLTIASGPAANLATLPTWEPADGPLIGLGGGYRVGGSELSFGSSGRKLDFLFNRGIDQSNTYNAARAAGNAERIGIADTAANRAEVTRLFNESYRNPSTIMGSGAVPGSSLREFFLPGVTGTGSKIQYVEKNGQVITIIAK